MTIILLKEILFGIVVIWKIWIFEFLKNLSLLDPSTFTEIIICFWKKYKSRWKGEDVWVKKIT